MLNDVVSLDGEIQLLLLLLLLLLLNRSHLMFANNL